MNQTPRYSAGWITVPYNGHDLSRVELQIGEDEPQAAFLDWDDGQRIAKLRPSHLGDPQGTVTVTLHVDGTPTTTGRVTIP